MSDAQSPVKDLVWRIHHTMLPVADLGRSIDFSLLTDPQQRRRPGRQA